MENSHCNAIFLKNLYHILFSIITLFKIVINMKFLLYFQIITSFQVIFNIEFYFVFYYIILSRYQYRISILLFNFYINFKSLLIWSFYFAF